MPAPNFSTRPLRFAGNPVIPLGAGGSFYEKFVVDPVVMIDPSDATKLVMWFSAVSASGVVNSIGRATSTVADPYTWVVTGQVLTHGGGGAFDESGMRLADVLYDSGTYYMYYTGFNGDQSTFSTGLATSSDGISWTKSGSNPVLTPTGQGRNDGTKVDVPSVIKEGSAWTMIYSYYTGSLPLLPGFRYATSSDGVSWTKGGSGDILATAPLQGETHKLYKIDGLYYLIYEAGSVTVPYRLFAAVSGSPAGPFVNSAFNPILKESGTATWDRYHVSTPYLISVGGAWLLFYSGASDVDQPYYDNTWPLGVATYTPRAVGVGTRRP